MKAAVETADGALAGAEDAEPRVSQHRSVPPIEPTPVVETAHHAPPTIRNSLKFDLPAGLVVFLVALPLCLGIALASGAPAVSGVVAGIAGGIIIPLISRSELSVSGPAAGLAAIVAVGITQLQAIETFALAVVIAGVLQIALGALKGGVVAHYIPSAVIKGMLAAIGILLILKQLPHALGYDKEDVAKLTLGFSNTEEISGAMAHAVSELEAGAVIICLVSMGLLLLWEKNATLKSLYFLPGPLVAVVASLLLNFVFASAMPSWALGKTHLVALPEGGGPAGFVASLKFASFGALFRADVWGIAVTLAVVASLETLLNIEAVDKLDPYHRHSPTNRELVAQGAANIASGLLGGLPVTSVVVRSSAGIASGGRTRMTAISHGVLLLVAVLFLAPWLNRIPLSCLAGILLMTGYKLTKPVLFRDMYRLGGQQFLPFVTTVVAIVAADLLKGIALGVVVSAVLYVRRSLHKAVHVTHAEDLVTIRLTKEAPFYAKAKITDALSRVPTGARVVIDAASVEFLDHDVLDAIATFEKNAKRKNIAVEVLHPPPGSRKY